MIPYAMPIIPGRDVSGVVEEIGAKVSRFQVGDAVYSRPDITRDGTYAEWIAVRESEVAFKPRTVSHISAAVLPLAGITAWEGLVNVGKAASGQRVLIHAAAGGVGSLAVQIAKAHGAHVIGTGSGANRALIESLGADEFVDYRTTALRDAVRNVDLVLERLAALVDEGKVRPVIGAEFALRDIRKAHALSEAGHVRGKIALHVGAP